MIVKCLRPINIQQHGVLFGDIVWVGDIEHAQLHFVRLASFFVRIHSDPKQQAVPIDTTQIGGKPGILIGL